MVYINFLVVVVVAVVVIVGSAAYAARRPAGAEALKDFEYDANNYNLEYHPPADVVAASDTVTGTGTWVLNEKTGNVEYVKWTDVSNNTLYYKPGSYPYGAASYVPTYEDSVYLSIMGRRS
jgi:hypothetical protein